MRKILPAFVTLLAVLGPATAWGSHEPPPPWPRHDRIYLMASSTDYRYWTVDRNDPELDVESITARCGLANVNGIPERSKPCLQGLPLPGQERLYGMFFFPAAHFEQPLSWSASSPLRFHFALDVDALGQAYTVRFVMQRGGSIFESAAATEVAPGIFEGTMGSGSPMDLLTINLMAVRVRTSAEQVTMTLHTRGKSWIDLPEPVGARGVPELLAESTYEPAPSSFETPSRTLHFNDGDWSTTSYTGDLSATRTFDLTLERSPSALVVWAEAFDSQFVYDVIRGRDPDPRKLTDGVGVRLLQDGVLIEYGGPAAAGQGASALAVVGIEPGTYTIEVNGQSETDEPLPFKAYAVAVYGGRTLASMAWRFPAPNSVRALSVGLCPGGYQPVPITPEATSFHVDLDWDTEAIGVPGWTLGFDLPGVGSFPCSEAGNGDWVRFTIPSRQDVFWMGPTPSRDRSFVSSNDTVFEMEVRYAYTAPPPEHEGAA